MGLSQMAERGKPGQDGIAYPSPRPVLSRLRVVGFVASAPRFLPPGACVVGRGAWCAKVTTSLRPRRSLSCRADSVDMADWEVRISQ